MSNSAEKIREAQQLICAWIGNFEKRSLESIKLNCEYLNDIHHLDLQNPIWAIFWPLVFNGVIDHVGRGFYALTEPIVLDYNTHYYYINVLPKGGKHEDVAVGIIYSEETHDTPYKVMCPSPTAILKKYPCIKDVIDAFPKTLQDENELKYVNYKAKCGLAELEKEGLIRYFSLPDKMYIRELPSRTINPEAYALAYSMTRVVTNEGNGTYNKLSRTLMMPSFAMPFMIYRVLLLECMASKQLPQMDANYHIFYNISLETIKQLNRIFCNSITIQ